MDRRVLLGLVSALSAAALAMAATRWHFMILASVAALAALASAALWLSHGHRAQGAPEPKDPLKDASEREQPGLEEDLDAKLAVAKRHLWPITVVQMAISQPGEPLEAPLAAALSEVILKTLRASDMAARPAPDRFLIVLDDTGEQGGVWAVERLQEALEAAGEGSPRIMAGLATYPTHALESASLLSLSSDALDKAMDAARSGAVGNAAQVQVAKTDPG